MQDFENRSNKKGYRFLKVAGDIFVLNLEFILVSALSLTILFFPSLFALVNLLKSEKESYINPFKDYFLLIKKYMKLGIKYWICFIPIYLVLSYLIYLDYQLIKGNENIMLAWLSLIICFGIVIALTSSIIELPLYITYFDNDKAFDSFQKASLIARKKILLIISSWMIILSFAFIFYMFFPLIFFFGVALMIYLIVLMSSRVYETLEREEKDRIKNN